MSRILLVEDNPLTAKGLTYMFEREHFQVQVASTARAAQAALLETTFDLILLDVGLPDRSGFQLAADLTTAGQTPPLIFLTARDDEEDIVRGLGMGAEDYVTKPFRNRELLLRVTNALARQHKITKKLSIGPFLVDPSHQTITYNGQPIMLTILEYRILVCLLENADQVVTRERISDEIWSASGRVVNDNTVSVYIKRLRQKLPAAQVIETVKKLGYRIRTTLPSQTHASGDNRAT